MDDGPRLDVAAAPLEANELDQADIERIFDSQFPKR